MVHDLLYLLITLASFASLALLAGVVDRKLADDDLIDDATDDLLLTEVPVR